MLTGDRKYIDGVLGAWDLMMAHCLHVGGSVALSEQTWFPPDSYYFQGTGEMCGSVFWLKLNHRLHRLFPDEERFVGEVERSLYNVVVAGRARCQRDAWRRHPVPRAAPRRQRGGGVER